MRWKGQELLNYYNGRHKNNNQEINKKISDIISDIDKFNSRIKKRHECINDSQYLGQYTRSHFMLMKIRKDLKDINDGI